MSVFRSETYNGIDIIVDDQGRFNITKLIKTYQPENNKIGRYLTTNFFKQQFECFARKEHTIMSLTQNGEATNPSRTHMTFNDFEQSMITINKGVKEQFKRTYISREFLNMILMVISPDYRAVVNATMDAMNAVNKGVAPNIAELQIKNTTTGATEQIIDWDRVRIPFINYRNHPEDSVAYQIDHDRWKWNNNDKMW
jgi:hypothetical protein